MDEDDFSFLFEIAKGQLRRHLVVANGVDMHSLEAVVMAVKMGIVTVTITGDEKLIVASCQKLNFESDAYQIIHCKTEVEAAEKAVEMVRSGKANLIMKGLISTDLFMKAILNKEKGILPPGTLLTHVTLLKNPMYHKPLLISDVAIIPLPDLYQKKQITTYLIEAAHRLGIQQPRVAFIAATEKVTSKMPATIDAQALKEMWENGEFAPSFCDGPMALDVALDKGSAEIKNIHSEVAGNADCLLFPNIEAGNVFYKTNTKLSKVTIAAIVMGTTVPTVLSSRGDTTKTKLNSIALAAMLG
ncbi:MAG: phosphate acyltransferase [Prolixibacteraceae bacterium]